MEEKKNLYRKIVLTVCISLLAVSLCFCSGKDNEASTADKVSFYIKNTVENQISSIKATWCFNGVETGSTGLEAAGGDEFLGSSFLSFQLNRDDISDEKELQKLSVIISITDSKGGTYDIDTLKLPSKFGDEYYFKLTNDNGVFSIIQTDS